MMVSESHDVVGDLLRVRNQGVLHPWVVLQPFLDSEYPITPETLKLHLEARWKDEDGCVPDVRVCIRIDQQ